MGVLHTNQCTGRPSKKKIRFYSPETPRKNLSPSRNRGPQDQKTMRKQTVEAYIYEFGFEETYFFTRKRVLFLRKRIFPSVIPQCTNQNWSFKSPFQAPELFLWPLQCPHLQIDSEKTCISQESRDKRYGFHHSKPFTANKMSSNSFNLSIVPKQSTLLSHADCIDAALEISMEKKNIYTSGLPCDSGHGCGIAQTSPRTHKKPPALTLHFEPKSCEESILSVLPRSDDQKNKAQ